jgi:hypothetical protein
VTVGRDELQITSRTMDSLSAISPKGCVAMKMVAPLLVVLALLALLAIHRRGLTVKQAEDGAVEEVVKVEDDAFRDEYTIVASLAVIAMFVFVIWTVLRANKGADQAMAPAKDLRASNDGIV